MQTPKNFPLNAWYAAAWTHEVGRREILARTVCNRKIALWRKTDGAAAALEDACWHRLLPLSMGRLDGDQVVCRYHGLAFDATGRCTHIPSVDRISPSACVRAYPVTEKHRYVWVWPGDPALADPALVPDMHWNDDPEWAGDGDTLFLACDYRLIIDNLMDLTHETFVHATSIGHRAIVAAQPTTTHDDRAVTVTRWMMDIDAPPFWRAQIGKPGNVDRWQIIHFEAPSTIVLDVGVALAGTGAVDGDRSQGVNNRVLNTVTPATDGTCMYFWSLLRNYRLSDQSLTTQLRNANARIFEEDREVVEAQQRSIDALPDRALRNLNIDAGSVWARRNIEQMIERESQPAQAGAARIRSTHAGR
ncbi:MAG: aromatic ring-hydroxylating dioxygenase subunit alpha [Gammaproteobacteria bacterium]|nr:aromatic ring-hydroxylating dioxygenase subunit alpha [Gammaproteobacteria bacterium]